MNRPPLVRQLRLSGSRPPAPAPPARAFRLPARPRPSLPPAPAPPIRAFRPPAPGAPPLSRPQPRRPPAPLSPARTRAARPRRARLSLPPAPGAPHSPARVGCASLARQHPRRPPVRLRLAQPVASQVEPGRAARDLGLRPRRAHEGKRGVHTCEPYALHDSTAPAGPESAGPELQRWCLDS